MRVFCMVSKIRIFVKRKNKIMFQLIQELPLFGDVHSNSCVYKFHIRENENEKCHIINENEYWINLLYSCYSTDWIIDHFYREISKFTENHSILTNFLENKMNNSCHNKQYSPVDVSLVWSLRVSLWHDKMSTSKCRIRFITSSFQIKLEYVF